MDDKLFCVSCGGEVGVRDTWKWLSPDELEATKTKYPNMQFLCDCMRCSGGFGTTADEARERFIKKQKWGMDRIRELEKQIKTLKSMVSETVRVPVQCLICGVQMEPINIDLPTWILEGERKIEHDECDACIKRRHTIERLAGSDRDICKEGEQ